MNCAAYLGCPLVWAIFAVMGTWATLAHAQEQRGEFGGDLSVLRRFYTAPDELGDGNHFIDLWGGGRLRQHLVSRNLANNRALIILSHGKGFRFDSAMRYGYYPDSRIWKGDGFFSAADMGTVLGESRHEIHNVIIAGCNLEHAIDVGEIRRVFVNATNITHAPGGYNGFELVFRHTLTLDSSEMAALYGASEDGTLSQCVQRLGFIPYIAHLYRAGAREPYAVRIAGRELLAPTYPLTEPAIVKEAAKQILAAGKAKRGPIPAGLPITTMAAPVEKRTDVIRWDSPRNAASGRFVVWSGGTR